MMKQFSFQQQASLTSFKSLASSLVGVLWLLGATAPSTFAEDEMKSLSSRLLAPPKLAAEAGFATEVLIPPGKLYDPLWMLPHGKVVWLNDDGGEENPMAVGYFHLAIDSYLANVRFRQICETCSECRARPLVNFTLRALASPRRR